MPSYKNIMHAGNAAHADSLGRAACQLDEQIATHTIKLGKLATNLLFKAVETPCRASTARRKPRGRWQDLQTAAGLFWRR